MCEESFNDKTKLHAHLQENHTKCEACGITFGGPKNPQMAPRLLRRHIKQVHEGQRDHNCEVCGKSFFSKSDMKLHLNRHNSDPGSRATHTCEVCGKSFTDSGTVAKHIRQVHEGEADNVCETCGKSFFSKTDMKRHIDAVHLKKPNVWKRKSNKNSSSHHHGAVAKMNLSANVDSS